MFDTFNIEYLDGVNGLMICDNNLIIYFDASYDMDCCHKEMSHIF